MITHDATFESLAVAPVKQTDVVVARQVPDPYGYYDDSLVWTSSDYLMSVNIDAVGAFLGTSTKKATVKLIGIIDTASVDDIFQVRLGLYDNDPSVAGFNYISEGFFFVEDIAYDYEAGSTTITMYDHMWKAQNTSYSTSPTFSTITYPITIENLAATMASAINAEFMSGFSSLPNASYNILADPYANIANTTLQNIIHQIAEATGTTARISDTTLEFVQYQVDNENLDSDTLKTLKIGKKYGPVNSVILGRVPQNDNVVLASASPKAKTISNINTSTNLFTVTGNQLTDGSLIRITSTGTYPAPLQADTNYYVYTNGNANTFALAYNYADAIAGTNLIDLTTAGTGTIELATLATQEIQINNNEILDDARQTLLPPIYTDLVGIEWNEVKSDTVGLPWHEVGDVIQFTQGATTVKAFISEVHLILAGSIKENLVSIIPDFTGINYQTAGGVMKTIYTTEIKVDKQENDITSIVSQQNTFEGQVTEDFTQLYQDIDNINLTIQKSGSGNLILNSVGYAKETATDTSAVSYEKLSFWDYNASYNVATDGAVLSYSSSESQNAGGASGQVIKMSGTDVYIEQHIDIAANTPLSFGLRVKNALGAGDATITLSNPNDTFTISVNDTQAYVWEELKIENFQTSLPYIVVKIQISSATSFEFTDLRLMYSSSIQSWVQSAQEILSTNVYFTKDGMRIFNNVNDTETRVTYNEFSTRRKADGVVLFEADDAGVVTKDLSIKGSTSYYNANDIIIRQLTIPASSALSGIAFIKGTIS